MNEKELIENLGGEHETMVTMCKLFARILYPIAQKANATDITFKVGDVTLKENNKSIGSVKVLYSIESEEE